MFRKEPSTESFRHVILHEVAHAGAWVIRLILQLLPLHLVDLPLELVVLNTAGVQLDQLLLQLGDVLVVIWFLGERDNENVLHQFLERLGTYLEELLDVLNFKTLLHQVLELVLLPLELLVEVAPW